MICDVPAQELAAVSYALQANGLKASEIKDSVQLAKPMYKAAYKSLDLAFVKATANVKAFDPACSERKAEK